MRPGGIAQPVTLALPNIRPYQPRPTAARPLRYPSPVPAFKGASAFRPPPFPFVPAHDHADPR